MRSPARTSSQKWFPVAITENQTQTGHSCPEELEDRALADERERDPDDERVGGVQARHRRIRVGGELHDTVVVRADEAERREHPRRRGRHEDVADEPEHVREQDPVAEAVEVVVAPHVDPEQGEPDDRELRVPVRPADRGREPVRLVGDPLEGELVERVGVALDADHAQAVVERLGRRAVGDSPHELVDSRKPNQIRSWRPRSAHPRGRYRLPASTTASVIAAPASHDHSTLRADGPETGAACYPPMKDISTFGSPAVSAERSSE